MFHATRWIGYTAPVNVDSILKAMNDAGFGHLLIGGTNILSRRERP